MAAAERTYPYSRALTMPGQSHQVSGADCSDDIISAFVDSASTMDLPVGCLATVPLPAFAVP